MNVDVNLIIQDMIKYYKLDPKRVNHFLKVYSIAKTIGFSEKLDNKTQYILEIAAIVHDIGIKVSEEKYNSSAGRYQEIEGPAVAENMLKSRNVGGDIIERVCYLVGHHHTYKNIEGMDYQILIESDFIVNIYEDDIEKSRIRIIRDKYFETKMGKDILNNMYLM